MNKVLEWAKEVHSFIFIALSFKKNIFVHNCSQLATYGVVILREYNI